MNAEKIINLWLNLWVTRFILQQSEFFQLSILIFHYSPDWRTISGFICFSYWLRTRWQIGLVHAAVQCTISFFPSKGLNHFRNSEKNTTIEIFIWISLKLLKSLFVASVLWFTKIWSISSQFYKSTLLSTKKIIEPLYLLKYFFKNSRKSRS